VSLQYFGLRTPARFSCRIGRTLSPGGTRGLNNEVDVIGNTGAKVINEPNVFPATASYLVWRLATQSTTKFTSHTDLASVATELIRVQEVATASVRRPASIGFDRCI
jgi:hypothetical protein